MTGSYFAERDGLKWAERLAQGDRAALKGLYDLFSARVQAVALHILRDPAEAEDLVQETFLEVWRRRTEFDRSRGSVVGWIVTIVRSRSLTRLQSRASAQRRDASIGVPDEAEPPRALTILEGREDRKRVSTALATLPPEQRRAIELAYFEGLTQQEIADRTDEPLGTIKTRVRLGMQKLATLLTGGGEP